MSRHKRNLKQAFLVTVAAAAVSTGSAACGNGVSFLGDDDGEVITNPPCVGGCETECPAQEPADGDLCFSEGASCFYGDVCDGGETNATCEGGVWKTEFWGGGCNPPPPECPPVQPTEGEVCAYQPDTWGGYPSYCNYDVETPCGTSQLYMGCQSDPNSGEMVWAVDEPPPSCELPPEQCQLYADATACDADSGCQWLVPGCTDGGNEVPAGCYAAIDCATEGCGEWGECFAGVHDPCHDSLCNACAAEIDVCLPLDTTTMP